MLVPGYVALHSPEDCNLILSVRPGITDLASVEFKDECEILGAALRAPFRGNPAPARAGVQAQSMLYT